MGKIISKLTKERRGQLQSLEAALGYAFKNALLLDQAVTHRSFIHETRRRATLHNERLEFLGDAVLELAISHMLMDAHPHFSEGQLSKLRAALVNRQSLSERAQKLGLGNYLLLGRGEDHGEGREKVSLLADAYEAVLGAIYLDRGYLQAVRVIRAQFGELLDHVGETDFLKDYKTQLQERVQMQFRTIPRYVVKSTTGPDHAKIFEVELWVREQKLARGHGKSKKMAEQAAASEALKQL